MKASDRGRNVKFLGNNFGCVLSKLSNNNYYYYYYTNKCIGDDTKPPLVKA